MPPESESTTRGRPRTKPAGVRRRNLYTTDQEQEQVRAAALAAGLSEAEWMRGAVLEAARKVRNPRGK